MWLWHGLWLPGWDMGQPGPGHSAEDAVTSAHPAGYQRQLTYKHRDGAYSAFGERDASGSMW